MSKLLMVCLVLLAPSLVHADVVSAEKRDVILKFIDVFGTRQALVQNFDAIIKQMPADKPEEAAKIRERIKVDEIIELLIPVYDKNFSTEELQAFINFYDSPAGRKLLTTIPEIMKESIEVSAKYVETKFPELVEKAKQ